MLDSGSSGGMGSVRSIRMGSVGVFGGIQRANRGVCRKRSPPIEIARRAGLGCGRNLDLVPNRSASCGTNEVERPIGCLQVLAFLAALVSAPVFSVLL